jgi:hypothetical protein
MRLTLRTMLAYMDDILDPADAEDVGKKIAESEFASSLMHRMRDVVGRLRLGAPKLQGRGMGLDPNTVAEYLDNKLPSDRVADFEKVCLESDVHLGEVAACHQILALILGEPAEIETTGRQRMYRLTTDPDAAPKKEHPPSTKKDDDIARARRRRKKKKRRPVEVPDYLREPSEPERGPWRLLGAVLAATLLVAAGLLAWNYWPNQGEVVVAGQPGGAGANADDQPQDDQPQDDQPQDGQPSAPANDEQAEGTTQPPESAPTKNGDRAEPVDDRAGEQGTSATAGLADQDERPSTDSSDDRGGDSRDGAAAASVTERRSRPAAARGQQPQPSRGASNRPRTRPSDLAADDSGDNEPPAPTKAAGGRRPRAERAGGAARLAPPDEPDEDTAESETMVDAQEVGRLVSEHEVLVRLAGKQARRVPNRGTIYSGETLIALPSYRPSIVLANGATLQLFGGTTVALTAADDGVPQVELVSGHVALMIVGRADTQMRLRVGDAQGTLTFGTADVSIAVEASRKLAAGADPEADEATLSGGLYLVNGQIAWRGDGGQPKTVARQGRLAFEGGRVTADKKAEAPAWIEGDELLPIERRASTAVDELLPADQPVVPTLTELVAHRKEEISRLAVRCLALLGHFDAIVPLLGDRDRHGSAWATEIESLRAALARGPEMATRVRKAFETLHGKEAGDELYRMLWSYDAQQLADGGAAQLVGWLSHEELDFRVLSYWNLHHLTGFGHFYRPADPEAKRRTATQKWRQKLEAGMLVPKLLDE